MKYYKDPQTNALYAYEADGSQDAFIPSNLLPISDEEAEEIRAAMQLPPPPPDPKLVGVEFDGVMCSATAADQAGLAAVLLAIQLQGAAFQPTRFYFENGNTLVISLANWQAFAAVWLPFRPSFFAVT